MGEIESKVDKAVPNDLFVDKSLPKVNSIS